QPSLVMQKPIGRVHRFEHTEVGLLTEAVYDDDHPLAVEALDAIRGCTLRAYSCPLRVFEVSESDDVTPDGEPIYDIVRGELRHPPQTGSKRSRVGRVRKVAGSC